MPKHGCYWCRNLDRENLRCRRHDRFKHGFGDNVKKLTDLVDINSKTGENNSFGNGCTEFIKGKEIFVFR